MDTQCKPNNKIYYMYCAFNSSLQLIQNTSLNKNIMTHSMVWDFLILTNLFFIFSFFALQIIFSNCMFVHKSGFLCLHVTSVDTWILVKYIPHNNCNIIYLHYCNCVAKNKVKKNLNSLMDFFRLYTYFIKYFQI